MYCSLPDSRTTIKKFADDTGNLANQSVRIWTAWLDSSSAANHGPQIRRLDSKRKIMVCSDPDPGSLKGQCHEKSFQTETVGV